jgi:succinylarginine dihydrolase
MGYDQLMMNGFRGPELISESRRTLDELSQILSLGSVYRFQY